MLIRGIPKPIAVGVVVVAGPLAIAVQSPFLGVLAGSMAASLAWSTVQSRRARPEAAAIAFFDQCEYDCLSNPELAAQARTLSLDNFTGIFDPEFMRAVEARADGSKGYLKSVLENADQMALVTAFRRRRVYNRLRHGG